MDQDRKVDIAYWLCIVFEWGRRNSERNYILYRKCVFPWQLRIKDQFVLCIILPSLRRSCESGSPIREHRTAVPW